MLRNDKSRAAAMVVLIGAGAALAGCGGGSSTGSSSTSAGARADPGGPVEQGGALTIGLDTALDTLDPQTSIVLTASQIFPSIYESLLAVTPDGKLVPALAKRYDYQPEKRRLSFTLDPRARFSNGDRVTSADVASSVAVWQKGEIYGSYYQSIASVQTPSPTRVVLRLKAPNAGLLGVLATSNASIYPKGFAGMSEKAYWRKPIGSGPYKVVFARLSEKIELARNPHYRVKGEPHFDTVSMRVIPDANQRMLQFQAGKLDIVNNVSGDVAPQYPKNSIQTRLASNVDVLLANAKNPATKSPQLRQALSLALDRATLAKGAFGDGGELPTSVEPQVIPGVAPCDSCDWSRRDVAGAKALAQQAGYDGKPIELLVASVGGLETLAAQAMVPMLAEAGITLKVTSIETTTVLDRLVKGDYELIITNYSALGPSPLDPLGFLGSTDYFYTGGDTKPIDEALAGVEAATDEAGIRKATAAYEKTAYESATVIPLVALRALWAVNDRVRGFAPPVFQSYSTANLSATK